VPVSKFNRIDKKVGNVTKHVEESLFKVTDKGLYSVEVLLFDGNLKVGRNDFDIVIHDMKDEDVEGASVKVIAQIPESDIKVKPRISGTIPGLYGIYNLNIDPAGHWELLFKIRKGRNEDSVVFDFPDVR
jgi:hypothetical protein